MAAKPALTVAYDKYLTLFHSHTKLTSSHFTPAVKSFICVEKCCHPMPILTGRVFPNLAEKPPEDLPTLRRQTEQASQASKH